MLTNGVCVFCWYKTNSWDSNGQLIDKEMSEGIMMTNELSIELVKKIRNTIKEFNTYRKRDDACLTFEEYLFYKLAKDGWTFEKGKPVTSKVNLPIDGQDFKE